MQGNTFGQKKRYCNSDNGTFAMSGYHSWMNGRWGCLVHSWVLSLLCVNERDRSIGHAYSRVSMGKVTTCTGWELDRFAPMNVLDPWASFHFTEFKGNRHGKPLSDTSQCKVWKMTFNPWSFHEKFFQTQGFCKLPEISFQVRVTIHNSCTGNSKGCINCWTS